MKNPYNDADFKLENFSLVSSRKYETVRGIIGNIHGVSRARNPAIKPKIKISIKLIDSVKLFETSSVFLKSNFNSLYLFILG